MRDNLLFFGIQEEKGETDAMCMSKVLEVIEKGCKIENAMSEMKIHRAHRIGRFQIGKVRPIVAKFMYYPDRERVRLSADKLARPLGISQQFPQEVVETRRRLLPIMKGAKRNGKEAYLSVDKLYIDGQLYRKSNPLPEQ